MTLLNLQFSSVGGALSNSVKWDGLRALDLFAPPCAADKEKVYIPSPRSFRFLTECLRFHGTANKKRIFQIYFKAGTFWAARF